MAKASAQAAKSSAISAHDPKKNLPATGSVDFAAHAGEGMEKVTVRDLMVPRLTILQSLSPQIQKSKAEFDPNAKVGDIYDVGLGEIIKSPMIYLPVQFSKVYIEWKPRRGGLVKIHDDAAILDGCQPNEKGTPTMKNGNIIVETAQFFGFNLSAESRKSFIPMAVTQLKAARRWNTLAASERVKRENGTDYNPPLFYRTYALSAVETSNDEGTWMVWKVDRHVRLEELENWESLFQQAVEFRQSIVRGETRGDVAGMNGEETAQPGAEGRM